MRFTAPWRERQIRRFDAIEAEVDNLSIRSVRQRIDDLAAPDAARNKPNLIIIGAGPVGQRLAEELIRRDAEFEIKIFGDEPHEPYNRVQLSSLLAGSVSFPDLLNPLSSTSRKASLQYINSRISSIDPDRKTVFDQQGLGYAYDRLVLATGSRAFVPNIPGTHLAGVYTFRTLRDAESLCARRSRARHIVVVGGGLLGLEAAYALVKSSTEITLVQQSDRVMNRQIDEAAAAELQRRIESKGIRLVLNQGVRLIRGEQRVEAVTTRYGECIPCDTVVFCTGIEANVELARNSGIRIRRGIPVDDYLQTSIADIFALGECSEHRGKIYGLVGPGLEQAAVMADRLCGGRARYLGSQQVSRLKVVGEEVTSIGAITNRSRHPSHKNLVYSCKTSGDYRKLVLRHGRLLGACGVGAWPESRRIQEAVQNRRYLYPWQRWKFGISGRIWNESDSDDIRAWPDHAIVCQCNRINRGTISAAAATGCSTLELIQKRTGAGTTCGTCVPLVCELLQPGARRKLSRTVPALAIFSLLSVFAAGFIGAMPPLKPPSSVTEFQYQITWTDSLWKQVTGFTILGLTLIGLSMSLEKRRQSKWIGEFEHWRLLHAILGFLALGLLFLHTGATFGMNLNRLLMVNFLGVAVLGGLTGGIVSWANASGSVKGPKLRRYWYWIHVVVAWPLPILLSVHILTVYYF
jgi:nitrite reductase (NADH) large subunit